MIIDDLITYDDYKNIKNNEKDNKTLQYKYNLLKCTQTDVHRYFYPFTPILVPWLYTKGRALVLEMILNDKITSTFPSYKNIVIVYYNLIDEDQNDQLSAENQRQQELIIKQQQEFLTIYRQSLARLQKEDPLAASAMPGFNALEMEEREKDIVEDMCRVVYSKRYYDLTHQYRYIF